MRFNVWNVDGNLFRCRIFSFTILRDCSYFELKYNRLNINV